MDEPGLAAWIVDVTTGSYSDAAAQALIREIRERAQRVLVAHQAPPPGAWHFFAFPCPTFIPLGHAGEWIADKCATCGHSELAHIPLDNSTTPGVE
jgi:hypothetical protein